LTLVFGADRVLDMIVRTTSIRDASAGFVTAAVFIAFAGVLSAAEAAVGGPQGAPVTFAKDIAPIFQEKCEECHHKGTASPMSLSNYEESRPWAKSIKAQVVNRNMPPWSIDKSIGIRHFANDRSLSEKQIGTIVHWVDAGAPLGDKNDLPVARQWNDENAWQTAKLLGEPSFVVKSEDYTMPAVGQDVWWKPVSALPITEERWVRAVEIRPGSIIGRRIMHHVRADLIVQDLPNQRGGNDYALMEWAIGKSNDIYREGAGKVLEPGAAIRWEEHLHAIGQPVTDHAELAVWLYPKGVVPTHKTVLTGFQATNNGILDISPNQVVQSSHVTMLKSAARLENFQPHMHLRGRAMMMEAILPDGTVRTLSYVNNFNFNWMNNYIYADDEAPVLPKGTMIRVTAWHDNTAANKNNPDPTKWVGQGDRTIDEMAHAWVNVTSLSDQEYQDWLSKHPQPVLTTSARP
jgi:hypothetical protein